MNWLFVAILSYWILAVVFLMDKYLLVSRITDPKLYAFYVGILSSLSFIIAPFAGFFVPPLLQLILSFCAGLSAITALFYFYQSLKKFETSRIVPAIGALIPLFVLGLIYIISGGKETLRFNEIPAFILLILGGYLVTCEKAMRFSFETVKFSVLTALFFSLNFVLTKYVYLGQPFWNGFIWISGGGFLMSLYFFFTSKDIREEIFKTKVTFQRKTMFIFITSKILGGLASLLQNWAVFLAPLAGIAIINALQGFQYAFLLVLTIFLSIKFPKIIKEEISRKTIVQKFIATFFIGVGLFLLVLR